jgi:ribonuclease E
VRAAEAPASRAADTTRGRRGRRNRSASRAQGAANETSVEHREATRPAAAGSVHEAKAPAAARPASVPAGNEPIILGVGVPASEL